MKKSPKKLSLNRETLANLQAERLGKVAVAGIEGCTYEDMTTCVCTDACNSGTGTGTGTGTASAFCPTWSGVDWTCCADC